MSCHGSSVKKEIQSAAGKEDRQSAAKAVIRSGYEVARYRKIGSRYNILMSRKLRCTLTIWYRRCRTPQLLLYYLVVFKVKLKFSK
jgi:hypothetical protein